MRARAFLLVLALMLSPLTSAMCELNCSPAPAAAHVTAHASCHEATTDRGDAARVHAHHCASVHPDAVAVRMAAGAMYQSSDLAACVTATDRVRRASGIFALSRPPGRVPDRPSVSSPPLRI